ncbi:MAG TPA: hypothetical protein VET66_07165 [Steroidobacteraceae bacterium]|nr:hypothetical protein [Steroidobacteraceae bacterium]
MTTDESARRPVSSLRELPQSLEPARDLWPQIEARLQEARGDGTADTARTAVAPRRGVPLRWLAAAAMVASVAVGMWIGRALLPAAAPGTPVAQHDNGQGAAPWLNGPNALDAAYVSDPRYERQRAALLRSLQARLAALPPPSREKVMASLAAIAKAKQDLEQALGKDPGNALLQELLVNTYQDEMRVLTDVPEASDPGRGI